MKRAARETELLEPVAESRLEQSSGLLPCRDEEAAERGDALGPRGERLTGRERELYAPERGVPLCERGRIFLRQSRTRREEPGENAVEIGATHRGAALHDRQPVGREDERRELPPERLRRCQTRAVELGGLPGAGGELDANLVRDAAARELQADTCRGLAGSGSCARPSASAARNPVSPGASPRAGSSSPPRCLRRRARSPARA